LGYILNPYNISDRSRSASASGTEEWDTGNTTSATTTGNTSNASRIIAATAATATNSG
jgi:hypothetical protein